MGYFKGMGILQAFWLIRLSGAARAFLIRNIKLDSLNGIIF
jgi:hypothetical protein